MKNILFLISLILLLASCNNEPVDFQPIHNDHYQTALDSLVNYDNYFIGEFNGEVLVSTEPFTYGCSVGNLLKDSVSIKFHYSYKISNSEELKTPFIEFIAYESINKLDPNTHYRYDEYNNFYTFFNRNELEYWEVDNYKNLTPQVRILHIDYSQLINNSALRYLSTDFGKPPFDENNFQIENIREIENPSFGIELTYSFNCTLLSDSNEVLEIKNGKGKCTFLY
ncbi:hypothetical protein [Flagellimonas hadalis]|uniref:Lipoprotein n=1 Tax=Flagellimonas hadalis TaxID=2597517 RepID=A0A5N5IRC5_9FLAO|nr:hypothetical protein [Allomuricauda hadalis]KAB5490758.1 hypothetical protein FOT42_004825 [Allomuricauda hadalis]